MRRLERAPEDGYASPLVPGLRASGDARRLAEEIDLAASWLAQLATSPPGPYGQAAALARAGDIDEAAWMVFLASYVGPTTGEDPFAGIERALTPWSGGALPDLVDVPVGPRGSHTQANGTRTLAAYRAWAARAGGQRAALNGEEAWTAGRRFARVFERLALPGLERVARFDTLVVSGALGIAPMTAETLGLGGADPVSVAAKRVFGIGDRLLLERRAAELARAAHVPLACLDLALWNWGFPERAWRAPEAGAPEPGGAWGALGV